MRRLTWGESFYYTWWVLAVVLTFTWTISILLEGTLMVRIILSIVVGLIWFFGFLKCVRDNFVKCSCGMIFSKDSKFAHEEHKPDQEK